MPLSTQTQVEQLLQINFDSDTDAACAQYIGFADGIIIKYIGFDPNAEADIVEVHDPTWTQDLWVDRPTIEDVTSVVVDGVTLDESDTSGYVWYSSGRVRRTGGLWSSDPQGIVVTYDGGYSTIPADLSFVSASLAARMMQAGSAALPSGLAGVKQIRLEGSDAVTFGDATMDLSAVARLTEADKELIDPYRRGTAGVAI